ncbi:MAG TPA: metallophosphoesterase, partial [Flavihumibacter sp.]
MKMQSVRAAMLLLFSHLLCNQFLYSQARPWFSWDSTKGKLPVTHYNFNDDTSLVQFAILSDNAGGTVPGIFADAVAKTNLLQPQFIMSVGDLINGYSTDKELIDAQWKEFQSIVEPLQSPFFYVAGNHDISNSWMQQDWLNRLGQAHYYFVYKNVLF